MFKNKRLLAWCSLILIMVLAGSCKSKFEKLIKSNNTVKKYQEGIRLYNNKSYTKALTLFDDLMQKYRGTADAEDLSYYYAYTNYRLRDYTTARYQFKQFADNYRNSPKAEECRFMAAYCFYLDSPNFSLDQGNTLSAIDALQLFINLYPKSDRVVEASKLIDDLRGKLETKSYANAKLYLDMGDYDPQNFRSAVIAFKNSLRDFPDTKYAEEMEFLSIKAQYYFAKNSYETRQEERYGEVVTLYSEFAEHYPESQYLKEAASLKKNSEISIAEVKNLRAQYEASVIEAAKVKAADTVKTKEEIKK